MSDYNLVNVFQNKVFITLSYLCDSKENAEKYFKTLEAVRYVATCAKALPKEYRDREEYRIGLENLEKRMIDFTFPHEFERMITDLMNSENTGFN